MQGYLDEDKKNALIPLKTIVENEVCYATFCTVLSDVRFHADVPFAAVGDCFQY